MTDRDFAEIIQSGQRRLCVANDPDFYLCTLPRDHEGDHEAHGSPDGPALRTWPQ